MSEGDALTALERLEQLHASGGLTDAEFAREKSRILDPSGEEGNRVWQRARNWIGGALTLFAIAVAILLIMPEPARHTDQSGTTDDTAVLNAAPAPSSLAEAGEAPRTPAAVPPDIARMTCGMDECTWLRLENVTQTEALGGARFMKFDYSAGTSTHPPRDDGADQYPETYDPNIAVEWEKASGAVLCSTQSPTVIEPDEDGGFYATRLNLQDVIGAEEYSANLYMLVCHGLAPSRWDADTASSLGYPNRPSSQFKVTKPEAVLTSTE